MLIVAVETQPGVFECQIPEYQDNSWDIYMQTHYISQKTFEYNFANGSWVKVREI